MRNLISNIKFIKKYLKISKILTFFIFLLTALISLLNLLIPRLSKNMLDNGILLGNKNSVLLIGMILITSYILKSIISSYNNILYSKVSVNFISNLKENVCNHMLNLPISFFEKNQTGYLLSRLDEIDSVSVIFSSVIFNFVISLITAIGAIIILANKNVSFLLISVIFLPLFYLLSKISMSSINTHSKDLMNIQAETKGCLQESFQGILDIKQSNAEAENGKTIAEYIYITGKKIILRNKLSTLGVESIILLMNIVTTILSIYIGINIINGTFSLGDYVSIVQYALLIYAPVQQLSTFSITIQPGIVALGRVKSILNIGCEDSIFNTQTVDSISSLEFKNVSFGYDHTKQVLNDVSFNINGKEKIALIGKNGSGKTTISKLILGLYNNYTGDISINNIDLRQLDIKNIRQKIGVVSQKIFLFSGSVEENVKIGNPNISSEQLDYIAEILKEDLLKSPYRNSFKIVDGGKNLSGGQIQKIAIARAILRNSDILIFDEATSNIDANSKLILKESIESIFKEKICIIITHDMNISSYIDKIFKIENSEITEVSF